MKYKAVIFDLDGTLLNTLDDLATSMNHALRSFSFPERSREEIRTFVGNGIRMLVRRALPEGTPEETEDKVFSAFHEHYAKHCADKTAPYDGALGTLRALREQGVKVAVISNKAHYATLALCERFFPSLIDVCVGQREGVRTKPAPDAVFEVLASVGAGADEAVFVGDADTDVETAKNAGCDFIGVTWGFRGKKFLIEHGARITVDTFDELYGIL